MTHEYICPLCTERAHYNRSPRIADYICGNKKCLGFMKPLPSDVDCDCYDDCDGDDDNISVDAG
jgi:hypothetical protein